MSRVLGPGAQKAYQMRLESGFMDRYLSGEAVLDIGYRGGNPDAMPITDKAIGVDLDYPGYDGIRLPFDDCTQDAVFVSHCLEHVSDYKAVLSDWYRVLKIGGYLIIAVPHQYLYERKSTLPSRFNADHARFYTPGSLLAEIEETIPLDGYRLRSLKDNDVGFDYGISPEQHAEGCYEIELVIEKIARAAYGARVGWAHLAHLSVQRYAEIILEMIRAEDEGRAEDRTILQDILKDASPPPFVLLRQWLGNEQLNRALPILSASLKAAPFDPDWYIKRYNDVAKAVADRGADPHAHYLRAGYFEGRQPGPPNIVDPMFR